MSVNVFLDDILGTTENFVTKLGLEMQLDIAVLLEPCWEVVLSIL